MAYIRTFRGLNDVGFDANNNLLVVPVGKVSTLYLVDTSNGGAVLSLEDESIASLEEKSENAGPVRNQYFSKEEKTHPITRIRLKGLRLGRTTLKTKRIIGADRFEPVTVQVVNDPESRQSGNRGAISQELREELQSLTLREAVLRVAEDQLHSRIGRNSGGFNIYMGAGDWCGAFCYYCWRVACEVKGEPNPFGGDVNALLSAQKAVSWALQTESCRILRYSGGDPYGSSFVTGKPLGKLARTQQYVEISEANPVLPADICILRNSSGNWQHVCMVRETPTGDALYTIDGNQGNPCIARNTRSMSERVNNNRDFALIFLHVRGVN